MKNRIHITKLIALVLLLFNASGCSKKNNPVPYSSIDFTIYLNDPSYIKLNVPSGWVYVTGGVHGIIIYRGLNSDFTVLDRTCTYNPNDPNGYVKVMSNNVYAIDSSCGSQFNILNGGVQHSPATLALKTYNYIYDASANSLHVYN